MEAKDEAIGALPIIGNIYSAVKMTMGVVDAIQEFRGLDSPDIIKDAKQVENYLSKYSSAMISWKSTALIYIQSLKNLTEYIGQYKV